MGGENYHPGIFRLSAVQRFAWGWIAPIWGMTQHEQRWPSTVPSPESPALSKINLENNSIDPCWVPVHKMSPNWKHIGATPSNVKLQIEILNLQALFFKGPSLSLLCHNHTPTSLLITTQHTKPLDSSKFRPGLFATFLIKYNIVIKCNQVVGHTLTRSSLTTM